MKEGLVIYKIEQVAKKVGLTKRTLRYYEELGLIPPPHRSEGGFRLYTDDHIERLNKLINARDVLGFSLQELQQYVALLEDFSSHRDSLKQLDDQAEKLRRLESVERLVASQIEMIDQKLERMKKVRSEAHQMLVRIGEIKQRTQHNLANQE
ncbi:MerR family transcriptional regulator [Cohnella sp. AR92]|uniref:MerR family transcriptional regulator n=1 Tax=Cohnella sp. AR92 TaxID=648716 RepID=UPI001863C117|nr:MerR family transcriptional regulator [Cohnella sp. AR92]